MKPIKILNKDNFNDIMFQCCGIYDYVNPFIFDGLERQQIQKQVEWALSANYFVEWDFDDNQTYITTEDGIRLITEDDKNIVL